MALLDYPFDCFGDTATWDVRSALAGNSRFSGWSVGTFIYKRGRVSSDAAFRISLQLPCALDGPHHGLGLID